MTRRNLSSTKPASLLLGLAFSTLAAAEFYDPVKHAVRWEDHRAPRISRSIPRKQLQRRQSSNALPQPGQPTHTIPDSLVGGFEEVGQSGVSAQQMFLGTDNLVYILDKVENNPLQINNHPAWATVYDLTSTEAKPLEVITNTFCAGGSQLGNGQWLNIGGNQAVNPGGVAADPTGNNTYRDMDGGFAARTITPGVGNDWTDDPTLDMTTRRWYPSLEPMVDGRAFVMGGDFNGGFVNDYYQSNPTYEFWPKYEGEGLVPSPILNDTLPANLYPITHLLPDGRIMLNINRGAAILDISQTPGVEQRLANGVPHAVRTYPASAATALLPLTVENGWNATVIYCGGSDIANASWTNESQNLVQVQASASCITFSPSTDSDFKDDDDLPEGRVLGNGILLPDGTFLVVNGAGTGVAGYAGDATQQAWSIDDGLANDPLFTPVIYDPKRPAGQRWSREGLQASQIPRMYHSTATLLPDGSVLVSGSNPHADYSPNKTFPTEYRVERFYPLYYNKRRPEPVGVPSTITYGGQYFDLQLSKDDLFDDQTNLHNVKIWLVRTGFSTHGINFGMRTIELDHTFTANDDGSAILHVSQAPPNPAIVPPGTSWFFVTINGVPSVGLQVMVGSGVLETQTTTEVEALPSSSNVTLTVNDNGQHPSAASATVGRSTTLLILSFITGAIALAW